MVWVSMAKQLAMVWGCFQALGSALSSSEKTLTVMLQHTRTFWTLSFSQFCGNSLGDDATYTPVVIEVFKTAEFTGE